MMSLSGSSSVFHMARQSAQGDPNTVSFVTGLRKGREVRGRSGGDEKTAQARPFLL
jgi:hypothetical protein